ncbi:MbcA/ParS/Xre antitoxin family protein [Bradyrhizobium sp. LHD-71]|uniref:MbcA/ParS/Xre antitoxin family protein n=1 Tax=Bradyrhizobium sp. LHD-71 TaxID=3072141 RepID=UPI00280E6799|nr:MbcA/ParS/Xre antitoxin family protein [Bradyrhizobium sp. LHD-71]MDQ8730511.1 MbcA/ParS/Xre antitoxin family protein [Bradyrhizobium sp. LHD-71]
MPTALAPKTPTEAAIVTKALVRASANLRLANTVLGAVVGLSEATISRMKKGAYVLSPGDKAYELSVLFVRMYRSLTAIVGGDDQVARAWLDNKNTALHAKPIERIQTVSGLVDVINYLDARRAAV